MKARLIYWHKAKIQGRFILEMKMHAVGKSAGYPDGIRYRLILVDLRSQRRVLMDNHHPKGHHVHLDKDELRYAFTDEERLIADFKKFVYEHLEVRL